MKVKNESEVTQSCPTPSDHMDCSLPGSSAHGIFQERVLDWGAIAFSAHASYVMLKILHASLQHYVNQMSKLSSEKEEEPEIKWPTFNGS